MGLREFRALAGTPRADVHLALEELTDEQWKVLLVSLAGATFDLAIAAAPAPDWTEPLYQAVNRELVRLQFDANGNDPRR